MKTALRLLLAPYRFSVDRLFRMGEIGGAHWFDSPSLYPGGNHPYLYKDNAGTTPVTAVGDTIGLSLDRAYGGARGVELFPSLNLSAGVVTGSVTGTTANTFTTSGGGGLRFAGLVSVGKMYDVRITGTVSAGTFYFRNPSNLTNSASGTGTFTINARLVWSTVAEVYFQNDSAATTTITSISVREIPGTHLIQATGTARPTLSARVNALLNTATMSTQNVTTIAASYKLSFTGTGTVTLSGTSTAGPLVGTGANDRVSLTFTPTAGTLTLTVSGSVTLADLRTADDAAKNIPAYQRVGATAADHDTDGFPHYALFDGTDDSWASAATVDGSGSDKVTVVAGVTKNSDAADGTILAFGDPSGGDAGSFIMQAPGSSAVTKIQFSSRGATTQAVPFTASTTYNAPITMVAGAVADIGAPLAQLSINGVAVSTITTTQGGGNYNSAKSVSVGQRTSGTARFNGRIYSIVGRFGAMSDGDRNRLEQWTKNLMRLP